MAYKPKVSTVLEGGTGVASATAYAVLCGGTTSTGAIQSVAALGSSGQVLMSNGAGALPSFQTSSATIKGAVNIVTFSASPADGQTYFLAMSQAMTTYTASGNADTRMYIPVTGTITKCYGTATSGTPGSGESSTVAIRLNNTTDTTVTSSLLMSSADNAFNNTGLSIAVTAGDYIEFKVTTPTWVTNPLTVRMAITVLVT